MCFESIVTVALSGVNSIRDLKRREIFLLPTLILTAAGIIYRFVILQDSLPEVAASLLPGLCFLALAFLLKGQIGGGDAFAILSLGAWNSSDLTLLALCAGLLASTVVSIVLLARGSRRKEIPFLPCLLAGEILVLFVL